MNTCFNPLNTNKHTYEVIENEMITSQNYSNISFSGALLSLTVFKNVTFSSCAFFGCKLENCQFISCKFENCTFQFSSVEYCDFHSASFENCRWDISPIRSSLFSRCWLDHLTRYFAHKEKNKLLNCQYEEYKLAA